MKYKKTIILLALVVFLLSITCVSASEIYDTLASEDTNTIGLSVDNDIIEDNLQTSEENEALASTDYDEDLSAQTDTEVLGADSAKYSDLAVEISQPGNINLTHKNYTYDKGETITISEDNKVIDGNGAVIDMNGSTIRAFRVSASGVTIKNLTIKNAKYDGDGGAVYFGSSGAVENCDFTNNTSTGDGGAIRFTSTGTVTNCNFTDNSAQYGGAVRMGGGDVTDCNFINNSAANYGGAILMASGTVSKCNFINNTAEDGGAIRCNGVGAVTNCNFTDNNATTGSAIYFYSKSATKTVSNSRFLNNRANAEALDVVKNDNNIIISFTGKNNLLNAIYSRNDAEVTFTNVTYWGANGITTVSAKLSGSNKAAGQNITVKGVVNGKIIDKINGTDENGEIVLDDAGDYWIIVSHKGDLYYTEIAETLFTNMKLYANVTSLTTNNKTVNITAKSNIFSEVMPGKLLFILPNGTEIEATYGGNGTWWAVHTFEDYTVYQVNATYVGLDNVTLTNATITINKADSTITMVNITLDYGESINVTAATTGATGITAKIDGKDITVINNFTIQISGLNGGNHTLEVTTIPDEDHNPVTETVNITVNKVASQVIVQDLTMDYQAQQSLVVNVKDSQGNPIAHTYVNITINGITYNCWVDGNGTASLPIELRANTYTADIKFENGNYNVSASTAKVTVKKTTPKITAKAKTFKKTVKTKKYTITLKDNTGKAIKKAKVTLKVKGKTYTAKTNSKGKATFKIKNLTKKGKYTAVIKYKGNGNYNKTTKKVKLTVKN